MSYREFCQFKWRESVHAKRDYNLSAAFRAENMSISNFQHANPKLTMFVFFPWWKLLENMDHVNTDAFLFHWSINFCSSFSSLMMTIIVLEIDWMNSLWYEWYVCALCGFVNGYNECMFNDRKIRWRGQGGQSEYSNGWTFLCTWKETEVQDPWPMSILNVHFKAYLLIIIFLLHFHSIVCLYIQSNTPFCILYTLKDRHSV